MSTLINKIIGNLATRMMLLIYLSIIFITTFFILFGYYNALGLQEQRQYDKLSAVVSAMAFNIDGDAHEELMNRYSVNTNIEEISKDSVYQSISKTMGEIVIQNELSPMYTLVLNEVDHSFSYCVRSDDFIDFGNDYNQSPEVLMENMNEGGVIPLYMTENGSWLSAYHPIKNSEGEVVAIIEADIEFSEFQKLVYKRYLREAGVALAVIVLIALLLIPYARKVLAADEEQKKLALHQKLMIESKNRDIMDSMRYALGIQNAMLPSEKSFQQNNLEGFIFHKAKDVVAGDFYWIERHENFLFFAVADCTGHGVPGAIISIICSNALNRVVDILKVRETNEVLDAVRKMVIKRLGKGDNEVKDGMDISLCRLNLDTLELQYSGANNPIYIYKKELDKIVIAKPCKQPVGAYVNEAPFKCESYQMSEGDLIYLFTDGFADQFGGVRGKKLKYKPFRELISSNIHISLEGQKKELENYLEEWMRDHDQVDDICVMGVKL